MRQCRNRMLSGGPNYSFCARIMPDAADGGQVMALFAEATMGARVRVGGVSVCSPCQTGILLITETQLLRPDSKIAGQKDRCRLISGLIVLLLGLLRVEAFQMKKIKSN